MEERFKESCCPAKTSGHWDMVLEYFGPKTDLVISRLSDLKTEAEELNFAAVGLETKVTCLEE